MAKKRVFAAIEIGDQEIRLVVMEVFDGRNNILRVERSACSGVKDFKIVDESAVVKAIQQTVKQAQNALGYHIEKVLLAIPSKEVTRSTQKVHITIEDGTRNIRRFHVQQGLNQAMQKKAGDAFELVNVNRITYYVNGTASDKVPIGQETDTFDMEVDLLYASKELLYSYARAIEQANLEILDVCLDIYAQGKETGALVQSQEKPVILLSLEAEHTTLTLFMQGKLVTSTSIPQGFNAFIADLKLKYNLSDKICLRLLQNLFSANEADLEDIIIYIEQQESRRIEITTRELAASVLPKIRSWISEINAASEPILARGAARYMITGQGSSIPVLTEMEKAFNAPASVYQVTSIGARDGAYVTCLGMTYAWQELDKIRNDDRTSVNNNELEESIESIKHYSGKEEGGFTQKLRKVILSGN